MLKNKKNIFKKGISQFLIINTTLGAGGSANALIETGRNNRNKVGFVGSYLKAGNVEEKKFKLPAGINYDNMKKKCADMLSAYTIIKYFPEKIKNLLNDNSGTEFTFDKFMNDVKGLSVDDLKDHFGYEIGDFISLTGWDYNKDEKILTVYKDAGAATSATWKDVEEIYNKVDTVIIKETVKTIGENAFKDLTSIRKVKFIDERNSSDITGMGVPVAKGENSVTIEDNAFAGCTNLTYVKLSNLVKTIGSNVFSRCTNLTNIELSDSVETIGSGAFSGCTELKSINIPDSVETIGDGAFAGCDALNEIILPANLTSLGENCFPANTRIDASNVTNGEVLNKLHELYSEQVIFLSDFEYNDSDKLSDDDN